MAKSSLHDAIVREICIALDTMGADVNLLGAISPMEELYLRKCDEAIRRAAQQMKDGWN